MDDGFSTTVTPDGDATLISVTGKIDIATCERLRDAIEPHLGPQQTIILDLSGVEFMDSSCINVLVQARGTLTADGGSLFLRTRQSQRIGWSRSAASKTSCKQMPTLNATENSLPVRRLTRCPLVWVETQQGSTPGDGCQRRSLDHAAG